MKTHPCPNAFSAAPFVPFFRCAGATNMKKPEYFSTRLVVALVCYFILALIATFTLDGMLRSALWLLFLGLAVRTLMAARNEDEERDD